jgi:hypothetical protein
MTIILINANFSVAYKFVNIDKKINTINLIKIFKYLKKTLSVFLIHFFIVLIPKNLLKKLNEK